MSYLRNIVCILLMGIVLFEVQAQTLSERQAVDQALSNHPAIRIGEIRVKQQRALERTAFNPSQPTIGIETPTDLGLGFEVEQEIDFPGVYGSRSRWLKSKTREVEEENKLTRNELIREVRLAYLEAQIARQARSYYQEQDSLWSRIAGQTTRLHEAGELGMAELLFAQRQAALVKIQNLNAAADAKTRLEILQAFTGTPDTALQPLAPLEMDLPEEKSFYFEDHLASQIESNTREIKIIRSEGMPGIILGYERSTELDTEFQNRYKAGISVPIWRGQYRGQILALEAEHEKLVTERELRSKESNIHALQMQSQIERTRGLITEYEQNVLPQTDELIRTYLRLYEGGEMDYSRALTLMTEASGAYSDYFEAMFLHNQAVIELEYLYQNF